MGSITDSFSNLNDRLIADYRAKVSPSGAATRQAIERDILVSRFLRPLLPSSLRLGTGRVIDTKDRQVGLLDVVACSEHYPPLGEGMASLFFADGVVFCLQVRNWTVDDLTDFGKMADELKTLERKTKRPVFCGAVSFEPIAFHEVSEFMKGSTGQAVDGVLSVGQHVLVRNTQGWYGDPANVPFVSEQGGPEALKSFAFLLLQLSQACLGLPFSLAEYQHL